VEANCNPGEAIYRVPLTALEICRAVKTPLSDHEGMTVTVAGQHVDSKDSGWRESKEDGLELLIEGLFLQIMNGQVDDFPHREN
jgi:hypothetical protein